MLTPFCLARLTASSGVPCLLASCAGRDFASGSARRRRNTLRRPALSASSTACLPYSHSAISTRLALRGRILARSATIRAAFFIRALALGGLGLLAISCFVFGLRTFGVRSGLPGVGYVPAAPLENDAYRLENA